ncbi:hypothetical protein FGIG_00029 [Fasciola gigantica]|uniref:Ig-like domain-containing protein n=1 Tax=Fasciola gigantica TaxID=46835 RepID=A0A504XWZ7_FASGI|nr:hypothetical protein FGIG_00029 [Fasciola gigantica]
MGILTYIYLYAYAKHYSHKVHRIVRSLTQVRMCSDVKLLLLKLLVCLWFSGTLSFIWHVDLHSLSVIYKRNGEDVTMECLDEPHLWIRRDSEIQNQVGKYSIEEKKLRLVLKNLQISDAGEYTCRAIGGESIKTFLVVVLRELIGWSLINFLFLISEKMWSKFKQTDELTVKRGTNFTLDCCIRYSGVMDTILGRLPRKITNPLIP